MVTFGKGARKLKIGGVPFNQLVRRFKGDSGKINAYLDGFASAKKIKFSIRKRKSLL